MNKITRKLLRQDLADEKHAPVMYGKLLKHLSHQQDKNLVRGIIKQEKQHYKKLKLIKNR